VLTDGHVLLRASAPVDLPAIDAGIRDPDVNRWIGPQTLTAPEVLARNARRWVEDRIPTLSICEPGGPCVGLLWMGFRAAGRSVGYVGYWLVPDARGRGFAAAAVRLISDWAVRELGVATVRLTTAPENAASQRVAERSGFHRVGLEEGQVLFERTEGAAESQG
jgi:RimJ/RimL family protein N-acetyltransferase